MSAPSLDDVGALEAGLDALERRDTSSLPVRARLRTSVLPPVAAAVLLLAVWSLLAASGVRPAAQLPSPSAALRTLGALWSSGSLPTALASSLGRALAGFALSAVLGTALGVLLAQVRWLRAAVGPLVSGLQSLPSATWLPGAVLWFGVGDTAVYVVVLAGAIPSIALGLVSGVDRVPPLLLRVGRVLGATRWETLRHVVLPAALPGYVSGLRLGWAFAWRSLMAAELILAVAGGGTSLGRLLDAGRRSGDMSVVLAVVTVILAVGVVIEIGLFSPWERRLLRDRGLAGGAR